MSQSRVAEEQGLESLVGRLADEFLSRQEAGERPGVEEYVARHPQAADLLRKVLASLQLLGPSLAGAAPIPAGGDEPASTLGDFRLIREVGRGGMGIVYEAEQISLGRRVALKVLPFAATMDPRQLQRFQNEARAAAGLHHTNIVPVFAVGCERGVHYYAMQFIEGRTLAAFIDDARHDAVRQTPTLAEPKTAAPSATTAPPVARTTAAAPRDAAYFRQVAEWGIQAAEALDCAHALGIVHRDVKPANLLVDATGRLWVTDFGLAQVQSDAKLTMTGDLIGTLRYMSPEQALAKRVVIDHRTDVYSLGATLYELVTLLPAFDGSDRQELLRQIAFEEPKAPRRVNKAIPAELETIVLKALEKNPADRFATAKDLADDLRHFMEDRPIRARRPTLVQRTRKWARRHKPLVGAAAVCLLVTVVAAGGSGGFVLSERASRQDKVQEALEAAQPALREGNPWDPALISAVERAQAQLGSGLVGNDLRQRVGQLHKDREMLAELERIRLEKTGGVRDDGFDSEGTDLQYVQAFRDYGINVETAGPQAAAALVQRSTIREHLLAALDAWAYDAAYSPKEERRPKARVLLAIVQEADPNAWRGRLREMILASGRGDLDQLVRSAPVAELPPATLGLLGTLLTHLAAHPSAPQLELLRRGQQRFPADFWINHELAMALAMTEPPQWERAIGYFRVCVAVRPHSAGARGNLANALVARGCLDEAIAEYREVLRLKKGDAAAHYNLGRALDGKGAVEEAVAEYREALRLKSDFPEAHTNLGAALADKGHLDEAIAEYRQAIATKRSFREAYMAHESLGSALTNKGQQDEAIAEFREAIRLQEDYAPAHYGLGLALERKGRLDEAIAEYRKAIRIKPDYPEAHCNLGIILWRKGQFGQALPLLRRGHELGSKDPRWRHPSAGWVKECERLVELDAKLPRVLKGETQPADAGECLTLAELCQLPSKALHAAAVRFYAGAFAKQPQLAEDLRDQPRYNAACAAALAGCGQGSDAGGLDDRERARLRRQALDWLRADLAAYRRLLDKEPEKAGSLVRQRMQHWQQEKGFAGVRGPDALAKLLDAERQSWQRLWQDVEDVLNVAKGNPTAGQK